MEGHDRGGSVALAWPPPPPVTQPAPGPERPRLSVGSIALVVAVGLAFADASIVVLALPEIYSELHTTIVGVSWVITAYALVVGIGGLLLAPFARRTSPGSSSAPASPRSPLPRSAPASRTRPRA